MAKAGKKGGEGKMKASLRKSAKSEVKADPSNWHAFVDSMHAENLWEEALAGSLGGVDNEAEQARVIGEITMAVADLLKNNLANIEKIRSRASDDNISLGFKASVSYSDITPRVKVSVSYSESFSDSREITLRDPLQPELSLPKEGESEAQE